MSSLHKTQARLVQTLLDERHPDGHWEGELSTSALSTATAVTALHLADPVANRDLVLDGLNWLAQNANKDGGWGDTTLSYSNISTTLLCWAAFGLVGENRFQYCLNHCEAWITERTGSLEPADLVQAVMDRYQEDHTFSVPILTMLTISGRLGSDGWKLLSPLPFELAAFPRGMFERLELRVVSYALPALIAIGQVIHHHRPSRNPFTRMARNLTKNKTLRLLESIQPGNGGFLEAIPLTSFVAMSLISMGLKDHPVVVKGIVFLKDLVRADGSWPIDTHLATWVTTLSINTLGDQLSELLDESEKNKLLDYLLNQQYREVHPFTGARPGGWAWTPLPGGVPDADDTSGAVLALTLFDGDDPRIRSAAEAGIQWLADLQNRDGGIPTFCRGWGRLPFDCSCPDITAHFLQAMFTWKEKGLFRDEWLRPMNRAILYLEREQRPDGSWLPLWFGNQDVPMEKNPTYGTAKVLTALQPLLPLVKGPLVTRLRVMIGSGRTWLINNQNPDDGWGGAAGAPSTLEETALAIQALSLAPNGLEEGRIRAGLVRLEQATGGGRCLNPAPIGFYFANLWYFEKLYPLVFTTGAFKIGLAALKETKQNRVTVTT